MTAEVLRYAAIDVFRLQTKVGPRVPCIGIKLLQLHGSFGEAWYFSSDVSSQTLRKYGRPTAVTSRNG